MSEVEAQQSAVLKTDTIAPDFTLHSTSDQSVSLGQFRGNPTILAFILQTSLQYVGIK